MKRIISVCIGLIFVMANYTSEAQVTALVNTSGSKFATLQGVNMNDVHWTTGFWADRFRVCRDSMIPALWNIYTDPKISHAFKNFEIAARLDTGSHKGPSFHDGDFYKTLEAVAAMYSATKDTKLDAMMDKAIAVIGKAQRSDGYIYTKAIIDQQKTGSAQMFDSRLSFEAYNIGHLMTAACVHYRATGKKSLLNIAIKATDFLNNFYQNASPEVARNAICPSHYMGIVEMYRTTGDPRYIKLAQKLIDIRGAAQGTDDNSDRYPFRQMQQVVGHAVRANYLFAGAADVYAETGDTSLLSTLNRMWEDVVYHKMYITGGCGALYDGVSNDGTSYNPNDVEKLHQAYGRDYQLPNFTAHNETCANIGNVLWNYRMLTLTGDAKYADVMELALYNSVLSGVSLNGKNYLYTNPLAYTDDLPFKQRWSKQRVPYISLSNCCPPNAIRTIAEVSDYAYSISDKGVWLNLYGGSKLSTHLANGSAIALTQTTDYPWNGNIKLNIDAADGKPFSLFLRIPGWAQSARININGKPAAIKATPGTYAELRQAWKPGNTIELFLPMKAELMTANPLVEETRNQVAVKWGPVVYCLEQTDEDGGSNIFNLAISEKVQFAPSFENIVNSRIMVLKGKAMVIDKDDWKNTLYRPIPQKPPTGVSVTLVPYYAWGNRGPGDMTVWMPVSR